MVVRRHPDTGERHLDLLKWGLLPSFTIDPAHAKRPINAQAEMVATSEMFRSAFARRRCLVPADAFYEWKAVKRSKQPYAIARADGQPMAFAGLWEWFRRRDGTLTRTFIIIITDANMGLADIHYRMPVTVEQKDWPIWLGEVEADPATLLRPAGDDVLRVWAISRAVNAPRNNGAVLLDRLD